MIYKTKIELFVSTMMTVVKILCVFQSKKLLSDEARILLMILYCVVLA